MRQANLPTSAQTRYDPHMRRALALVLPLFLAGSAVADKAAKGPHKEGEYGGVIPGQKPEKPKKTPSRGTLSWIGFEATNGGAKVFFQSPGAFEVSQHVEGSTLVVHLMLQRLAANTWRKVDTRFFDNPLSGIDARAVRASRGGKGAPPHPAGVQVRIDFKNPKDAREGTLATKVEADGMTYAYLTFPEGTADPTAPKIDAPPGNDNDIE